MFLDGLRGQVDGANAGSSAEMGEAMRLADSAGMELEARGPMGRTILLTVFPLRLTDVATKPPLGPLMYTCVRLTLDMCNTCVA